MTHEALDEAAANLKRDLTQLLTRFQNETDVSLVTVEIAMVEVTTMADKRPRFTVGDIRLHYVT